MLWLGEVIIDVLVVDVQLVGEVGLVLANEVAKVVDSMKVGQVSAPFKMINERGKTVCAIVKLKSRVDGHKATITEDFQVMKDVVMAKRREDLLHKWVVNKIKNTYVRIGDRYKNCDFEYEGWVR